MIMRVEKKVISNLNKCYAMAEVICQGKHCFTVAAEKQDPCYLFAEDGTRLETVWTAPGKDWTFRQLCAVPASDSVLLHFVNQDGKDVIVATNREIDEAAMYIITE